MTRLTEQVAMADALGIELGTAASPHARSTQGRWSHSPPPWVFAEIGPADHRVVSRTHARTVEVRDSPKRSLVSVQFHAIARRGPLELQRSTVEAYRLIAEALRDLPAREPVRFWNFIPDIGGDVGEGLSRYMVFNAGRFAAFIEWFGNPNTFDQQVATSTGVGHDGDDLVIHVLAADRPGVQLMNPRQIAPCRYSTTYGPFPPCFARATLLPDKAPGTRMVLIGGTAAVCGEQSVGEDLESQTAETFRNLESLLRAAASKCPGLAQAAPSPADAYRCFRTLRVYHRKAAHEPALRTMIRDRLEPLAGVEFLRMDICRRELLVEIEGTAVVGCGPA